MDSNNTSTAAGGTNGANTHQPNLLGQEMKRPQGHQGREQHKRNKLYVYFILRIHKDLIMNKNVDPLTLRNLSRLDEICKSIVREFYVRQGLLP